MKFSAGHFRLAALALFCPGAILAQGWTLTPAPTKNWRALAMSADGSKWVAATFVSGVFTSTQRGFRTMHRSWAETPSHHPPMAP